MNMRELRWKYLRPTDLTGKPYSDLCKWIEDLVRSLFPEAGIEYWADPIRVRQANRDELTPKEGKPDWVASVLSTVYHGRNEGRHIDIGLRLRNGTVKQITWAKSFGSGDECWAIARVVAEALELIFNYEEQPEIVDMYRKLPGESRWLGPVKLAGGVTVERSADCVSVIQADKKVLDARKFGGRVDVRMQMMDAYQADWLTLLRAHKVPVSIKLIVPESTPGVARTMKVPDAGTIATRGLTGLISPVHRWIVDRLFRDGAEMADSIALEGAIYSVQNPGSMTREAFLALQRLAESMELSIAMGQDAYDEFDARLKEIDTLLDAAPWQLCSDDGCIRRSPQ